MYSKDSDLQGKSRTFNTDSEMDDTDKLKNKLSNIKNQAIDEVEDTAQTISDRASDLKDSAVRTVKRAANSLSDKASDVKDRLGEIAANTSDSLQNTYIDIRDKAIDIEEDVIVLVKENPVKSLAITFLAGISVGLLLRK
jgi:ElaB/YqjD/DUF883 family membrane-anchored ribosome-binding protein